MNTVAIFPPRRIERTPRNAETFEMLVDADLERVIRAGGITSAPGDHDREPT